MRYVLIQPPGSIVHQRTTLLIYSQEALHMTPLNHQSYGTWPEMASLTIRMANMAAV